ncbi:MAG: AAA family ATPase [Pyrinomonadaceae bacterium]|nr:AAA family ATPase [Pyrinomonadaceae bacterium]
MHISKIELWNFKRFSKLVIDLTSIQPPKLVLLIGANGSGKSSLFDAFNWIAAYTKRLPPPTGFKFQLVRSDEPRPTQVNFFDIYFGKADRKPKVSIDFDNQLNLETFWEDEQTVKLKDRDKTSSSLFYGRSALRQSPRLTKNSLSSINILDDSDRPQYFIDADSRFENDVSLWLENVLQEVFGNDFDAQNLKERLVAPINNALIRIFGEDNSTSLKLVNVLPPSNGRPTQINFEKGESSFGYDLLSSGEKEIFGILLNLLVRRESFRDTIYFIDELDIHLNTGLQYALLKEISENWIPENCQFWTASHSLGFIQYARESENAALLDFDQFDFDLPQTIVPQPKENLEVYEIAVPKDMLSEIFRDKLLTFCENEDVTVYNSIGLPKKLFLPAKDKNDVYFSAKNNPKSFGVMDKDFLTPQEIELIRRQVPNLFVLSYYSIESYLYHPENLSEVIENFDIESYKNDLKEQKQNLSDKVIYGLKGARDSYKVLTLEKIKVNSAEENIFASLRSDNFEDFYSYLDMKKTFRHGNLNISKIRLAQSEWIEQAISKIFDAN